MGGTTELLGIWWGAKWAVGVVAATIVAAQVIFYPELRLDSEAAQASSAGLRKLRNR